MKFLIKVLNKINLTALIFSVPLLADGDFQLKGLNSRVSFEEGCKIMKSFGAPEFGEHGKRLKYTMNETACGYSIIDEEGEFYNIGGKFRFSDGAVLKNEETGRIKGFYLSTYMVDHVFNAANMNIHEFTQLFVGMRSWIDEIEVEGKYYTQRSATFGWKIQIGSSFSSMEKPVIVQFYEPSLPLLSSNYN